MSDAGNLWLEVRLDDDKAARVAPGQFAAYEIDGKRYSGTVLSVEKPPATNAAATEGQPVADEDTRTVIKISLPEENKISVGEKVRVKIAVGAD